jgi:hypothetical protein
MDHLMRTGRRACLWVIALLAIPLGSWAQSTRGALAGTITDPSGAVISGAHVVATQVDTQSKYESLSSSAGDYRFPELALGSYDVTVSATGFAPVTSSGVVVSINSTSVLNVSLRPGTVSETVNIDASAPTIESQSSDVSGTITQQQIQELPLSMATGVGGLRSPEAFAFLVPATTGPGAGSYQGTLSGNGVFFARLGGGQNFGAEVLLDGSSITRSENGSSFDETSPSIEALQEFKVTTSGPTAEFGRTTAGFESFAIKSGTNDLHGTAFTILKNAALDANSWYNNAYWVFENCTGGRITTTQNCQGFLRPQDSKFDYGGTLGGPVRLLNPFHASKDLYNGRDKTFFFFAWEQYKLSQGGTSISTVPTAAEKKGDFSALLGAVTSAEVNPCTGQYPLQNQIFDPASTNSTVSATNPNGIPCRSSAFSGNVIPSGQISGKAQAMLAGLPDPNQTPTSTTINGFFGNYVQSGTGSTENTTFSVRIDESLTERSKVFFSYSSRDNFRFGSPSLPAPYINNTYPQDFETHYIRSGWDYAFSPNLMNHLNVGYNRTNSKNFSTQIGQKINTTSLGLPGFFSNSFPSVGWDGLDGYSGWGLGNNGDNIDNGLRVNDSISWLKGKHSFKFGIDWRHQQYTVIQKNIPFLGFSHSETDMAAVNGAQSESGNSLASFLLGQVDNSNQTVYNSNPQWNSWYSAFFFQDDFKITPDLTVNLGLRYDIDVPRKEHHNNSSAFSFTTPDSAAGGLPGALVFGTNCHCNTAWAETWTKDFAPRLGFAYVLPRTKGKMVLRGSGSIIYGPLQYSDFGSSMTGGYTQNRGIGSNYVGPGTAAGFTPAFDLDSGYSVWTPAFFAPNTDPTQLTGGTNTFFAVGGEVITPQMGRPSMTDDWGLQVQDELAQDLIFTLGYIGESSQNLHSGYLTNVNNIDPKYFALGDHLWDNGNRINTMGGSTTANGVTYNAPYSTFEGALGQAIRPYPQYDYIAGDCCLENIGHSSFEAMTASLNRRFRQGFNLTLSYTWAKNETDADSALPFTVSNYRSQSQNSSDLHGEKSVSIQNIPQTVSISYLYQLPFGKGRQFLNSDRILDRVVGGWGLGAIQRYQSGEPVDFGCATGAAYYQNCFRFTRGPAGASGFASDDYRKSKNHPNIFNQQSWFKPAYRPPGTVNPNDPGVPQAQAAFVDENRAGFTTTGQQWLRTLSPSCPDVCSYQPYVFGTGISRVTEEITGPKYLAEDLSLLKNVAITERVKFILKVDASDAFNRHRQSLPDTEPGDFCFQNNLCGGFGIPTGTDYGPRNLQVSGRITF